MHILENDNVYFRERRISFFSKNENDVDLAVTSAVSIQHIILILMNKSVILSDKDENEMHLLLHPFTRERKKTAKERKKKTKTQKTKMHIFKNEGAYFQKRRRQKKK